MAHESGSFDYKVIDKRITNILDYRSRLNNTVQVAMPFVKATTTIQLPKFLGPGNYGFTLGLHALDQDVKTEDIYSSRTNNMPMIGYTYGPDGQSRRVYALDPNQEASAKLFDRRIGLFTNTDFVRVPPPGITSLKVSRMKSGRVGQATLTIAVPSLVQLESLHRTFLIPGVGMVVEWGQQFAAEEDRADPGEITDISPYLFPWNDRTKLDEMLYNLALNKFGLKDVLDKYVYPTDGQYMWMFGRVGNFTVKGNSDGSFDCTVKVIGPAEDAWAYSTKNTIVPAKDPSSQYFCANNTNSVYSYFTETVPGFNFKSLLDETIKPGNIWNQHVIRFKQDSTDKGKPEENKTEQANTTQKTFADSEDAYFITWRFFVNVVLNDPNVGVLGVFKRANLLDEEIKKIALLRPYAHGPTRQVTEVANLQTYKQIDDPLESFVGVNKYLRSVDPSTLIIVNEEAVKLAIANPQYNRATSAEKLFTSSPESEKMLNGGDFSQSALNYVQDSKNPDKGFLSSGVWLSHKAIIESMIGADTILRGITNLLERMNAATAGYWKLSLDVADGEVEQNLGHNYMVIDTNVRESSDQAVDKFIDKVHLFNKYVRVDSNTEELVGSELIDFSIDLNLPKLLFSQIATIGLVHPEDLQASGTTTGSNQPPSPKSPKMMQDDRLRKMFAVTSLFTAEDGALLGETERGPDLTILPKKDRVQLVAANSCGASNTNTTALTAGEGNRAGNVPIEDRYKDTSVEELKKQQEEAKKELEKEPCLSCKKCNTGGTDLSTTGIYNSPVSDVGIYGYPGPPSLRNKYQNARIPLEELVPIERGGLPRYGGSHLLYPEAAARYQEMKAAAVAQGIRWTVTSAYRDFAHQVSLGSSRTVAAAGSSPHGWGGAIDIGELYSAVRGSGDPSTNASVRSKSKLYNWLAVNGPSYGWYNPRRLADGAGVDECWHFEYWGFQVPPKNAAPTVPSPKPATPAVTPTPTPPVSQNTSACTDEEYLKISNANSTFGIAFASVSDGKSICDKCKRHESILQQTTSVISQKEQIEIITREFAGLEKVFRYVEIFPEYMISSITDDADGNRANAFGASPGTLSIATDLVLPGINGLRIGELFWVDRMPVFYKAFGAFQIMNIEDTISVSDGWKTKVHAVFNYMGEKWKKRMDELLNPT